MHWFAEKGEKSQTLLLLFINSAWLVAICLTNACKKRRKKKRKMLDADALGFLAQSKRNLRLVVGLESYDSYLWMGPWALEFCLLNLAFFWVKGSRIGFVLFVGGVLSNKSTRLIWLWVELYLWRWNFFFFFLNLAFLYLCMLRTWDCQYLLLFGKVRATIVLFYIHQVLLLYTWKLFFILVIINIL